MQIYLKEIFVMEIRRFEEGDEDRLFRVFFCAVHLIASRDYTAEQVAAWAPVDPDMAAWSDRMRTIRPFVVSVDGEIVGYADVQQNGYITHFFVSGRHPRRGIGAMLMRRLHEEVEIMGIDRLSADVSLTAEPFFRHFGFEVVERKQPVRRGVTLDNALMRKALQASAVSSSIITTKPSIKPPVA